MKYRYTIRVDVQPSHCYDFSRCVTSSMTLELPEGIVPLVTTVVNQLIAQASAQAYVQGAEWLKEKEARAES